MKNFLPVVFFLLLQSIQGQTLTGRVVDESNNRPLSYAIVLFDHQQRITYTDVEGYFSLPKDSLPVNDTLIIQYLGFRQLLVPVSNFRENGVYKLTPQMQSLQPVTITSCRNSEQYILNRKIGRVRQYIGPGPETRLVIIARYNNISGVHGYINRISILIDEKIPNVKVPVRLHWYKWDADAHMPGTELTDTSILVYPYQKGWNDFDLPPYTIPAAKDWIVFGLEFIYPPEYKQYYDSLKTNQEKLQWLSDLENRWSLSMEYVRDSDESGFYLVNNGDIASFAKRYERFFIRPALKFTITVCKE